jgi:DNA-binding Lrp family transcriptional regulator
MKLGEVLERVPGLQKRFVYYLEAQGDVRPARLPKARIARRDYSAEDVRRIGRLWEYYQRGYSLATARDLLSTEAGAACFVFLEASPRDWSTLVDLLRASERVREVAAVYGESADVIAEVEASRVEDVYQVLHAAFDRGMLQGPPTVWRMLKRAHLVRPKGAEVGMLAFVLLKVPAKQLGGVLERLRELDGVAEASVVYGETDIIAKLEVADQQQLDDLVIHHIQDLPEVVATRTFIAVGGMHWKRE